ncbi:sugar-transfer associated ATP-grasp domain-containing protein [Permianibacter aggregans]|uniref:Putative polysaccharide biosynthesis protein n=1 Tax=Permianibacter aggregans TaxID=1510150 RepID=A0A4R6UL20_9GAMM|nr:sugar-transfer associated ATP-grasp domain-containing protein [Permianibacter aggregans]TDQ47700.1 putative polysaccharide biosynthesis protein [Permianibacter aggregans]
MSLLSEAKRRLKLAVDILSIMWRKSRQGHLPLWRQLRESCWLKWHRQQTFRFYLMARMWRREMPWDDKLAHFCYDDFHQLIDLLNPPTHRQLHRHKFAQKQHLLDAGIRTPALYGFFHPDHGIATDGSRLRDVESVAHLLHAHENEIVVFKPEIGSGGEGVVCYRIECLAEQVLLTHPLTGESEPLATRFTQLNHHGHGVVIEAFCHQHPKLAALNPDSVNTLRIWVTNEGNEPRVLGCFLRIGRRHVQVDNTAAGGLICTVDDHGVLQELSRGDLSREVLMQHPDTEVTVCGYPLPFFAEAKTLALRALAAFPDMGIAGLDIAIDEHGPLVLEINLDNPAQIGTACFDRPGRYLFPRLFATEKLA